ncbi:3'-5' exonuclease [Oscillatoria sp. CS-180]|uniref:3'-5' exonuclease n=1 Tax=Oscillatoria sp. CS-180 TaxID=3021720 RepID=UPI00232EE7D3|nr:3'-5' exonuclease [Oscillatoria sp. CS-180]MDB9525208.1 3'-5' exonuclease [Oscillatoria sp. CS-180]
MEIAMLQMRGNDIVGHVDALVNPQRSLKFGAMQVNGMTSEMVAEQPTFAEVLPEVQGLLEGTVVVGHNVRFDLNFLQAEYVIAGVPFPSVSALDTLPVARKRTTSPPIAWSRLLTVWALWGTSFTGR